MLLFFKSANFNKLAKKIKNVLGPFYHKKYFW